MMCIATTSWDDGHRMDEKLSSLLLDYGIKGTFYIAKNWIESSGDTYLIKKLDKNFEIGAHTLSHPILTSIEIKGVMKEISGSKRYLENLLNHEVEMFSYPVGRYNDEIIEVVRNAGFIGARSLEFTTSFPKDPFKFGIGTQASNGSPLLSLKAWLRCSISWKSIFDWETRSKALFDYVLKNGGIWHLWGHSWEVDKNRDWEKLEKILEYVSNRKNVLYLENGETIKMCVGEKSRLQ